METVPKASLSLLITLLVGMISVILLCLGIQHFMHVPDYSTEINTLFPQGIVDFRPEPIEKTQYMMSLIVFPLTVFLLALVQFRMPDRPIKNSNGETVEVLAIFLYVILFLTFIFLDFHNNRFFSEYYVLKTNPFLTVIAFLAFLLLVFICYKASLKIDLLFSLSDYFLICMAITSSLYLSIMNVYSIHYVTENGMFTSHLNAVYHSVVSVVSGQYILTDISNQYGLYPHFLKPLYYFIHLNIYSFTWTMTALIFLTFVGIFVCFRNSVTYPFISFLGFTSLLYFCYIRARLVYEDPYFQYFPIRTLFPVILLVVTSFYFKKPKKNLYYFSFFILSLGVLWNIDTGLISLISWTAVLCFRSLSYREWKNCVYHIVTMILSFVVIDGLFMCYIMFASGKTPDIIGLIQYIQYFYTYGISMLPLKLISPWNIVVLIYAISLTYSIVCMVKKVNNYRINMIFVLSILGLGIFSYYQGRSDDNVLPNVIYPAIILSTIYVDGLLRDWMSHKKHFYKLMLSIGIIFIMFSSTASILNNFEKLKLIFNSHWENTIKKPVTPITTGVDFIKSHTKIGEKILILSFHSGLYYSESNTKPAVGGAGISEQFLKSDFDKLENLIKEKKFPIVYLDKNYLSMLYSANINVVQTLMDNYKLIDSSTSGNIMRFSSEKTQVDNINLDSILSGRNTIVDYKIYSNSFAYSVQSKKMVGFLGSWLPPFVLNENEYTLQIIVKPEAKQEPYAVIAGNHPGQFGHEGFVIMSANTEKDLYEFTYGDGKIFTNPFLFKLEADKWNYLVITLNGKKVSIYNNGILVKEQDQKNKFANSNLPFMLGDWMPANRTFKGSVLEFKASDGSLSQNDVVDTYHMIQDILNNNPTP